MPWITTILISTMLNHTWKHNLFLWLILAATWQAAAWSIANPLLWPDIWDVTAKLIELLGRVDFVTAVINSLWVTTTAFVIMCGLAVTISTTTHNVPVLRRFVDSLCNLIGPTPTLSWLPVFLIFFGFSKPTIYILMVWAVLWLSIPAFYSLLDITHDTWRKQVRNLGLSRWKAVRHVYLPSMLSGFVIISKGYFMLMWRVLFSIEIVFGTVGGHIGIGTAMYDFKGRFDHLEVYACMLMIMIMGGVMSMLFGRLQTRP